MTATFGAVARAVCAEDHRYADDDADTPITTELIDMLAAQTRFLDEFLAAAGRDGIRQVVILGCGLDTRAYRLWLPRETTVYEVDRPEVLDFKSAVLRGICAKPICPGAVGRARPAHRRTRRRRAVRRHGDDRTVARRAGRYGTVPGVRHRDAALALTADHRIQGLLQ